MTNPIFRQRLFYYFIFFCDYSVVNLHKGAKKPKMEKYQTKN